jgi:hypothetical protein
MPHRPALDRLVLAAIIVTALTVAGCGKDSCIPEPSSPAAQIEFGEGIEVVTLSGTLVRRFTDYSRVTYNGRPALPLQTLIGTDAIPFPDLYGFRFIGTDGFYANMPGKRYGDNTWSQLGIGYLDLVSVRVVFDTVRDPMLRKGHNVKWLIRVEVLRSIDVAWNDGRRLAPIVEITPDTVAAGYPGAGTPGLLLSDIVGHAVPGDLVPRDHLYRVIGRDGSELPRLLTWEEAQAAYYLLAGDRVVLRESLGPSYQVNLPRTIRIEGGAGRPARPAKDEP